MFTFRGLPLGLLFGLLVRQYVACSSLGSAINSVFLHVNNVSVECGDDLGRRIPYFDALIECAHDAHCCFVAVDEVDAHTEGPGLSRLCSSCDLANARVMKGARISLKGERGLLYHALLYRI
uniref:Secreted protein n=1 Tax=Babesia bovis TaxID=5865 RepID=S6BP08_BABBO|nr:hypothetical protein [Babesia bovis]